MARRGATVREALAEIEPALAQASATFAEREAAALARVTRWSTGREPARRPTPLFALREHAGAMHVRRQKPKDGVVEYGEDDGGRLWITRTYALRKGVLEHACVVYAHDEAGISWSEHAGPARRARLVGRITHDESVMSSVHARTTEQYTYEGERLVRVDRRAQDLHGVGFEQHRRLDVSWDADGVRAIDLVDRAGNATTAIYRRPVAGETLELASAALVSALVEATMRALERTEPVARVALVWSGAGSLPPFVTCADEAELHDEDLAWGFADWKRPLEVHADARVQDGAARVRGLAGDERQWEVGVEIARAAAAELRQRIGSGVRVVACDYELEAFEQARAEAGL